MLRIVVLLVTCAALFARGVAADAIHKNNLNNPYEDVIGCLTGTPPNLSKIENTSSQFVEDHFIEQSVYTSVYDGKYQAGLHCAKLPLPSSGVMLLPKGVDDDGHPLYFDGADGRANLSSIANALLLFGQYDALDRLFNDWSNPSDHMADGRWKLFAFDGVLAPSFRGTTRESVYQNIRTWRARSPSSVAAAVAEALYWLDYANDARGEGYAKAVTPEGWALYEERARKAEAVLRESQRYAQANPYWSALLIRVGLALNWPKDRLLAIFRAQTAPQFAGVVPLATALSPKWGGSWRLVEDFAKEVAEKNRSDEGYSTYARIYDALSDYYSDLDPNIFHYTFANWPDVKRSFDELVRLFPHSAYNYNRFAAFACMADDKATFQSVRFLVGKTIVPNMWPMGYSVDLCEHKFALQPL